MSGTWSIQTPPVPGAIAVIQVLAPDAGALEHALSRIGVAPIGTGRVGLRSIAGIDTGLVARWTEDSVNLMPHGGPAVVRAIARALNDAGLVEAESVPARRVYPEARSGVEAEMLAALARAASPLAVDLLLDQPRRWAAGTFIPVEAARPLSRLIDPPLVVAVGPPNIGKSSLVNALAGRLVSIVADEPGTTRDHVGVLLDLAGLVVRYIDTPGVRPPADAIERDALALSARAAESADLVLRCGDAASPPVAPPAGRAHLTIALRADLGAPAWVHDASVTVVGPGAEASLRGLVGRVRDALVPPALLADGRAWRFH